MIGLQSDHELVIVPAYPFAEVVFRALETHFVLKITTFGLRCNIAKCRATKSDWSCTAPELFTFLSCYFTERLLHWAVTLLSCYFSELLLYWAGTLLSCYFTELWRYWTVTLLSCHVTELLRYWAVTLLYWAATLLSCYFSELLLYWAVTLLSCYFRERATMGGWFLKENIHKTQ